MLARSLPHSQACGKVDYSLSQEDLVLFQSALTLDDLSHQIGEESDVDFVENRDFFSFVFFFALTFPKVVSSDEGDVGVAPLT